MNILNSGRFGVGAGAGGGLRKLIGIKNQEKKKALISLYIALLMPSFYLRHCIIKIRRPEQPLLWLKICTWVQISGHELHRLYCPSHDLMSNADCRLCTHDHIYLMCSFTYFQAKERLLKF